MIHWWGRFKNTSFFKVYRKVYSSSSHLLVIVFCVLFSLHTMAMVYFEGWPIEVALWFTVTAGTTVGFGDYSPATSLGRLSTVFLIYVPTIPIVAILTGRLVEKVMNRRERKVKGNWRWKMKDHIIFINFPKENGEFFFNQILSEFKKTSSSIGDKKIIIVSDQHPEGLPESLKEHGIKLVSGRTNAAETLEQAAVRTAANIIIINEAPTEPRSDSLVFDIASLIIDIDPNLAHKIVAEANLEGTQARLKKIGINNVIRPIRAYPELVSRTIISPGTEQVIENLFNSANEECLKFPCRFKGTWMKLVNEIISKDLGTPIAVQRSDGTISASLNRDDEIDVDSVFIIVPEGREKVNHIEHDLLGSGY